MPQTRPSTQARQPSPPYRYLIIGAGRQGTAAAYDLARFGDAARIVLADRDMAIAARSADRVNRLSGTTLAESLALDVSDHRTVEDAVQGMDVVLSAVPYYFNLPITRAAVAAGAQLLRPGRKHRGHPVTDGAGFRGTPRRREHHPRLRDGTGAGQHTGGIRHRAARAAIRRTARGVRLRRRAAADSDFRRGITSSASTSTA